MLRYTTSQLCRLVKPNAFLATRFNFVITRDYNSEEYKLKGEYNEEIKREIKNELGSMWEKIDSGEPLTREEELYFDTTVNRVINRVRKKQGLEARDALETGRLKAGEYRYGDIEKPTDNKKVPEVVVVKRPWTDVD